MATSVVMPQMGYDMQEGTLVRWLKQEGEAIARGEAIAEIETDKAVIEMEAYASGVVLKTIVTRRVARFRWATPSRSSALPASRCLTWRHQPHLPRKRRQSLSRRPSRPRPPLRRHQGAQ